jgi:hypothetical protein
MKHVALGVLAAGAILLAAAPAFANDPPTGAELADAPLLEAAPGVWTERPTVRDFMEAFPRRALETGVSGEVSLECLVGADHRLRCLVREESVPHRGFGEAALELSEKLRITETLPNGQETAGGRLYWDVSFATTGRAAITGEIALNGAEAYPVPASGSDIR